MSTILARTSNGDVRGLATGKVRVFKGIRYGAPTSETRFQPPRRPAPWRGVADACEFGPAAPQTLPGAGFRAAGFYYRVDYETPVLDGALMAPHGVEVPFVFGSTEWSQAYVGAGPAVDSLAELMGSAWLAFAEHGDPRAAGDALSEWPPYAADAPTAMIFDGQSRVELNPQAADRPVAESVFQGLTRNTDLTL
jgi:carboxylesterase type B